MSMSDNNKFWSVDLEFMVNDGKLHWATQVLTDDEDGAVKQAVQSFWAQFDFNGPDPEYKVLKCAVVESDGHLADPMSHDYHEEPEFE